MGGADRGDELCRVRHVLTGLYVGGYTVPEGATGVVHAVELQLADRRSAWAYPRATAEKIANVWIALTGDRGIETEPAED